MSAGTLFGIHLTNLLLMIVTLGFYRPFAVARLYRYQAEAITLIASGTSMTLSRRTHRGLARLAMRWPRCSISTSRFERTDGTGGLLRRPLIPPATRVVLRLNDGWLYLPGESIERRAPLGELRLSEPMGAAPRLATFPDGAYCEIRDAEGFAQILAASGHREHRIVAWQFNQRAIFVAA